ncbi:MAG: hypothetical protein ACRCYQ_00735 [Nocardioides sp.]
MESSAKSTAGGRVSPGRRMRGAGLAAAVVMAGAVAGAAGPASAQPDSQAASLQQNTLTITQNPSVRTVIQVFRVPEADKARLVARLREANRLLTRDPRLVSATAFGQDGLTPNTPVTTQDDLTRVVAYVQLRAVDQSVASARIRSAQREAAVPAASRPREYVVAHQSQRDGSGAGTFTVGEQGIAINEVTIDESESQSTVLGGMVENDRTIIREQADRLGWRSTNIHTSTDGLRNVNVVEFSDRATWVSGFQQLPAPTLEQAGLGTPDLRPYQVLDVVHARDRRAGGRG